MDDPNPQPSPRATLLRMRIIWAAMILGQLTFLIVVAVVIAQRAEPVDPDLRKTARILFAVGLALLLGLLPMGYILRSQFYKRGWQGGAITPAAYFTGNLILWALCEGVAFLGLLGCLIQAAFWPPILATVLALAAHVVNFPTGRPLEVAPNPYE